MRIISSFKDYYDNVGKTWDFDYSTIIVRKPKSIQVELNKDYFPIHIGIRYFIIIGFAGKLYCQINDYDHPYDGKFLYHDVILKDSYGFNNVVIKKWLDHPPKDIWEIFGDIFLIYNTDRSGKNYNKQVVYADINCDIRSLVRILPPAEAYMQLYNWVCNKARPEKPIPTISNDDKIINAGFDLKKSFRHK